MSIALKKIENIAYFQAGTGRIPEMIKEGIQYLSQSKSTVKVIIEGLNEVTLEIGRDTTFEQALEKYESELEIVNKKREEEYQKWLETPEGIEHQMREKLRKKMHGSFVFKNFNEAMAALEKIQPVDLTSEETSPESAMKMCIDVMTVIAKCERFLLNEEQHKLFTDKLKSLGCTSFRTAAKKFQPDSTLLPTLTKEKNIAFPLTAFDALINCNSSSFNSNLEVIAGGAPLNGLTTDWLKTQGALKINKDLIK